MGAKVTVQVRHADGTPVPGARIHGINHDAWAKSHKEWSGTANESGQHTWDNLDTGTLGDRYTFQVEHVDPKGVRWVGEESHRIKSDSEIVITLAKGEVRSEKESMPAKA